MSSYNNTFIRRRQSVFKQFCENLILMNRVQICKLWSLEDVKPNYWFDIDEKKVYNEDLDVPVQPESEKNGCKKVRLSLNGSSAEKRRRKRVPVSVLTALACIFNGPFGSIIRIDGDVTNDSPENLCLLNMDGEPMFEKDPSLFRISFKNGRVMKGKDRELAGKLGMNITQFKDMIDNGLAKNQPYNKYEITSIIEYHIGKDRWVKVSAPVVYIGVPDVILHGKVIRRNATASPVA